MADHGTVEYATATGNDYPAHESDLRALRAFHLRRHPLCRSRILFGLAIGGVMGHWFMAAAIFVIGAGRRGAGPVQRLEDVELSWPS